MIAIVLAISLSQQGLAPISIVRDPIVVAAPAFAGFVSRLSADGHTLLTGGMDGSFQFWKLQNDKVEFLDAFRIEGWENAPESSGIAYDLSGDGKRFLVSLWNGRVEVWQRSPFKRIFARYFTPPSFNLAGLHPSKPWLFLGSYARKTERIDLDSGRSTPTAATFPMAPVPGTTKVVTLSGLVDGATGKLIRKWKSKVDNVEPLSVSPDGKLVVIGGEDPGWSPPQGAASEAAFARTQTLRVWRISDGKLLCTMPGFDTMGEADSDVVWLSNNKIFVPGLGYVRNAFTGKRIGKQERGESDALSRPFNAVELTIRDASGGAETRKQVTLPEAGARIIGIAPGPDHSFAILRDSAEVYRSPGLTVGSMHAVTTLWPNGKSTSVPVQGGFSGTFGLDATGPYASTSFGGINEGLLTILTSTVRPNMAKKQISRIVIDPGKSIRRTVHSIGVGDPLRPLFPKDTSASPYDSLMVTFGEDLLSTVRPLRPDSIDVWDARTGTKRWTYSAPNISIGTTTISFSKDRVAVGTEDYTKPEKRVQQLRILSAADGHELNRFDISNVYGTSFSPDGKKLAVMGSEVLATIDFSARNPQLHRLDTPSNPSGGNLDDLRFLWSRDSQYLTVSTSLRPIQVFDADGGALVATMRVFKDGSWLATRADGTVDGTRSRLGMAKTWDGTQWVTAQKIEPFMLQLLSR